MGFLASVGSRVLEVIFAREKLFAAELTSKQKRSGFMFFLKVRLSLTHYLPIPPPSSTLSLSPQPGEINRNKEDTITLVL